MNLLVSGKSVDIKIMEDSDLEQVRYWRNSDEVSKFMLSRAVITKENQSNWFSSIRDNKEYLYGIIMSKDGERLGVISLNNIREGTAEPSLYLGSVESRNSFFGIEAYYHMLNYGFAQLGIEKVWGTVLSFNKAAMKMNTSFGFIVDAVLKDEIEIDNSYQDIFKLSLTKEMFYKSAMVRFFRSSNF